AGVAKDVQMPYVEQVERPCGITDACPHDLPRSSLDAADPHPPPSPRTWRLFSVPTSSSVRALRREHHSGRAPHDLQVGDHRPVLDVAQVEADALVPAQVAATRDLPETGDP